MAAATVPRLWQGVAYRPLTDLTAARALFDFAAAAWPAAGAPAIGWGAFSTTRDGEPLVGALVAEASERAMLFFGPVAIVDRAAKRAERDRDVDSEQMEIAAQLVSAALDHAVATGAHTIFARPQGVDRIWIRFGFIPVPEGALPHALAGRPGAGLYAWRGGSALWSLRDIETS